MIRAQGWRPIDRRGLGMAFLSPGFEYDVFVSYSHGDPDAVGDSPLKHWTSEFVRALHTTIRSIEPELQALDIWFDARIDPTKHLTDELRQKVRSSAILMVVMSPPYLASAWCNEELKWFHEQVLDRKRDQGRVFVVHALPTIKAKWPGFLQDDFGNTMIGFPFHEPQTGMPFGWGEEDIIRSGRKFNQQLWTLQAALAKRLRELQGSARRGAAPAPFVAPAAVLPAADAPPAHAAVVAMAPPTPAPAGAQRVYLHARPQPEYANLRNKVRGDLEQEGLKPLPVNPPAPAGKTLGDWSKEEQRRFEDAKRCAALALVRADDDEAFYDELYKIGVDERELIEARLGKPLPCAVLDGSGKQLEFDCPAYDISRFDLDQEDWRSEFRAWFKSRTQSPALPGGPKE